MLGAFLLLTSTYCLLAYIPFSYFGFIRNPLLWWLPIFVKIHPYLYGGLVCLVGTTLLSELRAKRTRNSVAGFLVLNGTFSVYMLFDHGLASLSPFIFSYLWSMFALFPLVWLAALDITGRGEGLPRDANQRSTTELGSTTLAALAVATCFAGAAALRQTLQGGKFGGPGESLREFGVSVALHLVIFTCYGVVACLLRVAASKTRWPSESRFVLTRLLACVLCALALRILILPAISFEGVQADVFSFVLSVALTLYVTAINSKSRSLLALTPNADAARLPAWLLGVAVMALCAVAYAIPVIIGPTDWDFVLQKCAVLLVWASAVAFLGSAGSSFPKWQRPGIMVGSVLVVTALGSAVFAAPWARSILEDYAGPDISLRTASTIFSRSVRDNVYQGFYEFLRRHTNLRQPINAVDVSLTGGLSAHKGDKPNIFLFVIDSLRQDYISAYNPSVTFTPEIGKFASDSVVFRNAFTRYAGTALSEPAIWVGAMQIHKQYVEPFYPMNNLQKLLDVEGYQSYISVDPILQQILRPSVSITALDKDLKVMSDTDRAAITQDPDRKSALRSDKSTKNWSTLDFVATLKELESDIDQRADKAIPIFAYTQPQNVHTLTLEQSRRGSSREEISQEEIKRMDAAFGAFVQFLVNRRLYDNSVIIITSDHGDYYGEFGRWGHADFLFPQVIRIPLIVHLPPAVRKNMHWDDRRIAFSMDITPSLYYLLGYRPTVNKELFGRPLFTEKLEEQEPYLREYYLIASSYAPVYGLLSKNGEEVFIADAVNRKNYFYRLAQDPQGIHNRLTPELLEKNETLVRHQIELLDSLYALAPN